METLLRFWKYMPEMLGSVVGFVAQWHLGGWLMERRSWRQRAVVRQGLRLLTLCLGVWVVFGFVFQVPHFAALLPRSWGWWLAWIKGAAIAWACASLGAAAVLLLWRRIPRYSPERRVLMRSAAGAFAAIPFAAMGFGIFVQRKDLRVREVDLPVPGLPKDLEGLRLVQLSDIHLSPFLSERELARAIDMANETRPQVALVTGDLITAAGDPLDTCLRQIARLRAEAGVLGCLGNHEIYANAQDYAAAQGARLGIGFLRQQARQVRFGSAVLNFAGVDYQRLGSKYLAGAERLVVPGAVNVLLSHNPDVFPVAARQGYDLTISGHTHGGQVTVEILSQTLNVARFYTPYVYGLYQQGPAAAYVTRGIGTVGVPARIGAPPEIALLRLCAT